MYVDSVAKVLPMQPRVSAEPEMTTVNTVKKVVSKEGATPQNDVEKDKTTASERQTTENEKIRKAIEQLNACLPNSEAKFGIHEQTNRVMIKLVDKDTQEVIREIPPEKTLDMIAKCMEIAGVLMDEKL